MCRQLRERMLHDREVAIEGERAAAQKRLSETAERYEASAQQARMHLVADHDRRLGEAEDSWRMQRRELQEKVKQLEQIRQDLQDANSVAVREALSEAREEHNAAVKVCQLWAMHIAQLSNMSLLITGAQLAAKKTQVTRRPSRRSMMPKIRHGGELLRTKPASNCQTRKSNCERRWSMSATSRLS